MIKLCVFVSKAGIGILVPSFILAAMGFDFMETWCYIGFAIAVTGMFMALAAKGLARILGIPTEKIDLE